MAVKTKVRNKDRLIAKLKKSAPKVAERLGDEAYKGALEMVATAQSYVPVDSGDLKESIVATPGGKKTPAYSQPGGSQVVPEHAALVTAGNSDVRYPHLVEYGTRPHKNKGRFAGTDNPGAPAQPYFWPAFRLLRKRLKSRMTRALNKELKKLGR